MKPAFLVYADEHRIALRVPGANAADAPAAAAALQFI